MFVSFSPCGKLRLSFISCSRSLLVRSASPSNAASVCKNPTFFEEIYSGLYINSTPFSGKLAEKEKI